MPAKGGMWWLTKVVYGSQMYNTPVDATENIPRPGGCFDLRAY